MISSDEPATQQSCKRTTKNCLTYKRFIQTCIENNETKTKINNLDSSLEKNKCLMKCLKGNVENKLDDRSSSKILCPIIHEFNNESNTRMSSKSLHVLSEIDETTILFSEIPIPIEKTSMIYVAAARPYIEASRSYMETPQIYEETHRPNDKASRSCMETPQTYDETPSPKTPRQPEATQRAHEETPRPYIEASKTYMDTLRPYEETHRGHFKTQRTDEKRRKSYKKTPMPYEGRERPTGKKNEYEEAKQKQLSFNIETPDSIKELEHLEINKEIIRADDSIYDEDVATSSDTSSDKGTKSFKDAFTNTEDLSIESEEIGKFCHFSGSVKDDFEDVMSSKSNTESLSLEKYSKGNESSGGGEDSYAKKTSSSYSFQKCYDNNGGRSKHSLNMSLSAHDHKQVQDNSRLSYCSRHTRPKKIRKSFMFHSPQDSDNISSSVDEETSNSDLSLEDDDDLLIRSDNTKCDRWRRYDNDLWNSKQGCTTCKRYTGCKEIALKTKQSETAVRHTAKYRNESSKQNFFGESIKLPSHSRAALSKTRSSRSESFLDREPQSFTISHRCGCSQKEESIYVDDVGGGRDYPACDKRFQSSYAAPKQYHSTHTEKKFVYQPYDNYFTKKRASINPSTRKSKTGVNPFRFESDSSSATRSYDSRQHTLGYDSYGHSSTYPFSKQYGQRSYQCVDLCFSHAEKYRNQHSHKDHSFKVCRCSNPHSLKDRGHTYSYFNNYSSATKKHRHKATDSYNASTGRMYHSINDEEEESSVCCLNANQLVSRRCFMYEDANF